jgi:hypothetical protein
MNKRILGLVSLLMLPSISLLARELRTPWSIYRGAMHHPLPWPVDDDKCWHFETWGAGFHRDTNKAFLDKETTQTESLAGVVFGRTNFIGLDAFAPGTISPANPFLAFAQITPKFHYSENSAYFGLNFAYTFGCDCRWNVGFRSFMPFRSLRTQLDDCCDLEETLGDVCRLQNERVDGADILDMGAPNPQTVNNCYAYRFDFLNSLFRQQAGVPPFTPLVRYDPFIRIAEPRVDNFGTPEGAPVSVIRRVDATPPIGAFCVIQPVVNDLPPLASDGSGGANNDRLQFVNANNPYTPLGADIAAQRQLWIVPTVGSDGTTLDQVAAAREIGDVIQQLTRTLPGTGAIGFLADNGVSFASNSFVGAGDLDTEVFVNYEFCRAMVEGIVGLKFPTGIRVEDPGKVLSIFTTGNNRHFEFKVGAMATWEPNCWYYLKADLFWSHAFRRNEKVAASFQGSTVKNIGPTVNAKVSWDYFVGHLDSTFLVPCNPCVGFMVGYECYVKLKDRISFDQTTAVDFLGNTQPLDPSVLEFRTNVVSHKIRTEVFHQANNWQIFGGWTHVFAGRNATKDSDWHLGLATYF